MLGRGTLVWVTPKVNPNRYVDLHGALWVVSEASVSDPSWYWCRSLATNMLFDWHKSEIEEVKDCADAV
jgi:hypothetical protein